MEQLVWIREVLEKFFAMKATQWLLTAPEVRYLLIALVVIFAISYVALLYNNLVRLWRNIDRAWSNIDVLLKQRNDELKKLVEICKQYMSYEQSTLEQVILARGGVQKAQANDDKAAVGIAEAKVLKQTHNLLALAEGYPGLQSSSSFKDLERRVTDLEQAIADRREYYNETVTYYNTRIQSIPDNVIAGFANYEVLPLIIVPDADKEDTVMKELGNR